MKPLSSCSVLLVYFPILCVLLSCGKGGGGTTDNPPKPALTINTISATDVTSGHVTINGEITNIPYPTVTVKAGIVWDTKSHDKIEDYPNTNNYSTNDKQYKGALSIKKAGFVGGTTYYARIYAGKTDAGYPLAYGKEITFTTKPPSMEIGEFYAGGQIFYVDETGKHGLVTEGAGGGPWEIRGYTGDGLLRTSTNFGTGKENTEAIIGQYGTVTPTGYAALYCYNFVANGYSDWYLPSRNELMMMKQNLYETGYGMFQGHFWSSSITQSSFAWEVNTISVTDAPDQDFVIHTASVMAVRNF